MSKTGTRSFQTTALLVLFSAALTTGCGEEPEQQAEQPENDAAMIEREAPQRPSGTEEQAQSDQDATDFRVVPRLEGKLEEAGMGLETIIDASNKQAFADSMSWIAEDVSQQQYKRLERSLRYIQAYDSSVLGNEQRFLELIDGKTGQELIDRAGRLLQDRRGG